MKISDWEVIISYRIHSIHDNDKWIPQFDPELIRWLYQEIIDEFVEIFINKLLSFKGLYPGISYHRIILKDPDKSINDHIFQLPERFLNHLAEFLQEYIDTGRIYPLSSNMITGTWMISKPKDLIVISYIIYNYHIFNENMIKDHIPLPH
jgi:hypothetical protein